MDQFDDDNTHRSLPSLVSVNAWFKQEPDNDRRFTLHANVSFDEERLGGGGDSEITFKLSVRRCNIVFLPPFGAPFTVDPASVRMPKPLNPKSVIWTETTTKSASGKAKLSLSPSTWGAGVDAEAGGGRSREKVVISKQQEGHYNEIWKLIRGRHTWSVDGRDLDNGRLAGPVFDAHDDPRLIIIDGRSDSMREKDAKHNIHPVAHITVSCVREDIEIYDIKLKEPEKQNRLTKKPTFEAQQMVAREVLKEALIREGLVAGSIATDPYAEMTICDVAISIIKPE